MPIDFLLSLAQYWEAIIATSALMISAISLLRDKRSREMDMLHDVFRNIGQLNAQILNYNSNERDEEQRIQDGMILLQEKYKEYDYLCFLINRKKVKGRDVYELGGEDMIEFYENYNDQMDDNKYSDIDPVIKRWESHPPTTMGNRLILWFQKTI